MVLFYRNKPGDPGIILWEVAVAALCFEVLYRSLGAAFRALAAKQGVALDPKRRPTFARDGNSYAVSFVHAFVVVWRGCRHLVDQYGAPLEVKPSFGLKNIHFSNSHLAHRKIIFESQSCKQLGLIIINP